MWYKRLSDKRLSGTQCTCRNVTNNTTATDETAHELNKGAWLLLAYADWSSECWDLAETWEKVGKDLGRYVKVARFNYEKSPKLAKKFQTFSVPMIYCYVDGASPCTSACACARACLCAVLICREEC